MNAFSKNLKLLRESQNLSIRQLAKMVNFSDIAISRWERGTQIPTIKTLVVFVKFFNVSADYLLGLSNNPKKN